MSTDTKTRATLFFGGLPTGPDIKTIRELWPDSDLTPGTLIPYGDVASAIGVSRSDARFRTVTCQWRKLVERESNIIIGVEPGEGFLVLGEHEKVDLSGSKLQQSTRAAKRSHVVAVRTNTAKLDDNDKKRLAVIQDKTSKLLAAAQVRVNAAPMPSLLEGNGKS